MKVLYWVLGMLFAPIFASQNIEMSKIVNKTDHIKSELYEIVLNQEQESKNNLQNAK